MTKYINSEIEQSNQAIQKERKANPLQKLNKVKKFFYAALVGITLASCQSLTAKDQRRIETLGDDSPMVQAGYQTYLEGKTQDNQEDLIGDQADTILDHETFEVPATDQRILPGSRVQVVETGGIGLNVRSEVGTDSELVTTVPEGTIFKVVELAGEKDGYTWVLVESEDTDSDKIIGYVAIGDSSGPNATRWLVVLKDEPMY
jgi:hypothetical protein